MRPWVGGGSHDEISVLVSKGGEARALSVHPGRTQQGGRCLRARKGALAENPDLGLLSLQNREK